MSIMQSLPDCLGFGAFCFPESLLVRRWNPNDTGARNNALQITSAMQASAFDENLEFLQSQISITADNQFIHDLSRTPHALWICLWWCSGARPLSAPIPDHSKRWTSCPPSLLCLYPPPPLQSITYAEMGEALPLMSLSVYTLSIQGKRPSERAREIVQTNKTKQRGRI